MLQLSYVVVSSKELTRSERIRLVCEGHEFGAILTDGVLKVNKDLKKPKKLEKLVRKMFEVDHLLSEEDDKLLDMLYDEICANWGGRTLAPDPRCMERHTGRKAESG